MSDRTQRIWELDASRGLAIIGMIAVHFLYDLVELVRVISWHPPVWYEFFKLNAGGVFLVISGISVTLGSRCVRRGLQVLVCSLLVFAVTMVMALTGLADDSIVIWFGVLQCLGCCMLLWALLRHLPNWALALMGTGFAAAGIVLQQMYLNVHWSLIPLGLAPAWFASSDYFPLLPNLGYFLLGAVLGRTVYRNKMTRFPKAAADRQPVRSLCWLGRHSLPIYLLHQPILAGIAVLLQLFLRNNA